MYNMMIENKWISTIEEQMNVLLYERIKNLFTYKLTPTAPKRDVKRQLNFDDNFEFYETNIMDYFIHSTHRIRKNSKFSKNF